MAGRRASWLVLGGLAAAGLALPPACRPKGGPLDTGTLSVVVADLLADVGPRVVLPALETFLAEVSSLDAAVADWEAAVSGGGDAEGARATAQARWEASFAAWQALELMQVGPAGSSLSVAGGADLRDEVYSWPTVNPCRVDQETVGEGYAAADFFEANLVNSYGLDSLEHLLHAGADNTCPSQVDINADGTWDALGEAGVEAHRAAYAGVLVDGVAQVATELQTRWSAEGGDFSGTLGTAAAPYEGEAHALNDVFAALFYVELSTRDSKVALPLGVQDCAEERCPEDVEARESGASLVAIEANLLGFRALFTGGEGVGFDDLLVDVGHADLSTRVLDEVDAALAAARAIEGPLEEAVVARPEQVEALYQALTTLGDTLEGDLVTVLSLEIPSEAAGDND